VLLAGCATGMADETVCASCHNFRKPILDPT